MKRGNCSVVDVVKLSVAHNVSRETGCCALSYRILVRNVLWKRCVTYLTFTTAYTVHTVYIYVEDQHFSSCEFSFHAVLTSPKGF